MKVEQNQIDELKKKRGEIYEGEIDFDEESGKHHAVAFIFRKPKTIDAEAGAKNTQTVGAVAGNLNLPQSLVARPEPAPVVEALREYPLLFRQVYRGGGTAFFRLGRRGRKEKTVDIVRLFTRRFPGGDVSALDFDGLEAKYEEARIMREFEAGVMREAIAKAFGSGK